MAESTPLTKMYAQPSDNSPYFDRDSAHFEETFKGPYNVLKDYPHSRFKPGKNRVACIPEGADIEFDPPDLDVGWNWIVESARVTELPAGDHALLKVTYVAKKAGLDSSFTLIDKEDVWSLTWQSYTVSPYAFCKNKPGECGDVKANSPDLAVKTYTALREHVEAYLRHGVTTPGANDYQYQPAKGSDTYALNYAERHIFDKIASGKQCVYHYPVLTHRTVKMNNNGLFPMSPDTPSDVDYINTPSGSPYTLNGYDWLKVGDNCSQSKSTDSVIYTREQVWWGCPTLDGGWDENFYSTTQFDHSRLDHCRWKIGEV